MRGVEHGKERAQCAECQNLPCTMEGCPQFGHRFCSVQRLLYHMRAKHSGQPRARTKTKELIVYHALQAAGIAFEYQKYLPYHGCDLDSETKCRNLGRLDKTHGPKKVSFFIVAPRFVLALGVDPSFCSRPSLD